MMTHGSFAMNSASSLAEIRTSVMAASPFYKCKFWLGRKTSHVRQHLAQLLGGGRNDGDEIGFAKPTLGTVAHEIATRAAVEHGGMRGRDARFTGAQPKRDHLAPVVFLLVVGVGRERHRFAFELGEQFLEVD